MKPLTINPKEWRTPLSNVPDSRVGSARLRRKPYTRGLYHMNGVAGYEHWYTSRPLPVMALQQRHRGRQWDTWMVDDPVHWLGMREAVADLPAGRIIVAGLGLGLMLHHMAAEPRFTDITVIERNPDVVKLIAPTLPEDYRVSITVEDFYRFIAQPEEREGYDGVLWDLAVGNPAETLGPIVHAIVNVRQYLGPLPLRIFGLRDDAAKHPEVLL